MYSGTGRDAGALLHSFWTSTWLASRCSKLLSSGIHGLGQLVDPVMVLLRRACVGALELGERLDAFEGVLRTPWTSLTFSLTLKPFPHNYLFKCLFCVPSNDSRSISPIGNGAEWVVCGQICFDYENSWNLRAAEASKHTVVSLCSFLVFSGDDDIVGCILNSLRLSAGRICNANLRTSWNFEKSASMKRTMPVIAGNI